MDVWAIDYRQQHPCPKNKDFFWRFIGIFLSYMLIQRLLNVHDTGELLLYFFTNLTNVSRKNFSVGKHLNSLNNSGVNSRSTINSYIAICLTISWNFALVVDLERINGLKNRWWISNGSRSLNFCQGARKPLTNNKILKRLAARSRQLRKINVFIIAELIWVIILLGVNVKTQATLIVGLNYSFEWSILVLNKCICLHAFLCVYPFNVLTECFYKHRLKLKYIFM